jgi:hypothetical protein
VGSPLIKVAAFSYGVRSTVRKRQDAQAAANARRDRRSVRSGRAVTGRRSGRGR